MKKNSKRLVFDRACFERAKKTQREVAREMEIDEAYLSKVVRNRISPSVDKAIVLARCLGCTVEELFVPPDAVESRRPRR